MYSAVERLVKTGINFGTNAAIDYAFGNNVFGDITKYVLNEATNDLLTNITLRAADGNAVTLEYGETYKEVHLTDETVVECTPGCIEWNPSPVVSFGEREVYQCNVTLENSQPDLLYSMEVCPETSSWIPWLDIPSKITQFFNTKPNDCVSKNTQKVCFDNANKNVVIGIIGGVVIVVIGGAVILTTISIGGFTKNYLFEQRKETKKTVEQFLKKYGFGLFGQSADEAGFPSDEETGKKEEERQYLLQQQKK